MTSLRVVASASMLDILELLRRTHAPARGRRGVGSRHTASWSSRMHGASESKRRFSALVSAPGPASRARSASASRSGAELRRQLARPAQQPGVHGVRARVGHGAREAGRLRGARRERRRELALEVADLRRAESFSSGVTNMPHAARARAERGPAREHRERDREHERARHGDEPPEGVGVQHAHAPGPGERDERVGAVAAQRRPPARLVDRPRPPRQVTARPNRFLITKRQ